MRQKQESAAMTVDVGWVRTVYSNTPSTGPSDALSPAWFRLRLWSVLDRTPRKAESAIRAAKRRNNWVYLTVSKADCSTGFTLQDMTALGSSTP